MSMVWIFLVLTNGHIIETGGFQDEETCNSTRNEIIVQREAIGHDPKVYGKPYMLTNQFEATKCFQVWKK